MKSKKTLFPRTGKVLACLRRRRDLTVRALAKRAKVSPPFVVRLERGERTVTPAKLMAIARAMEPDDAAWQEILIAIGADSSDRNDHGFYIECLIRREMEVGGAKLEEVMPSQQGGKGKPTRSDILCKLSDGTKWALELKRRRVSR